MGNRVAASTALRSVAAASVTYLRHFCGRHVRPLANFINSPNGQNPNKFQTINTYKHILCLLPRLGFLNGFHDLSIQPMP